MCAQSARLSAVAGTEGRTDEPGVKSLQCIIRICAKSRSKAQVTGGESEPKYKRQEFWSGSPQRNRRLSVGNSRDSRIVQDASERCMAGQIDASKSCLSCGLKTDSG